jgi:hypothetical protein
MNETLDELKTVAILALQSPVVLGSEEQWRGLAELFSKRLQHPVCVVMWASDERSFDAFQSTIERYSDQGFQRFVVMPIGLDPFDFQALGPVFGWIRSERKGVRVHIARSWTTKDWVEALLPAVLDATVQRNSWIHVALGLYLDSFACRSIERYFMASPSDEDSIDNKTQIGLIELDRKVDSMLPSEYRGRTDEVNPQSMGAASIDTDRFGEVAWDEIWTSFCDLAMAGGPPHRGRLLEAITAEQANANLTAYDEVVREIRRGIEMVTGLQTVPSIALGWVGVVCDNEAMAVWLMRAIIVENVMVRREGSVLFLPAGPEFTVKREIKNVITSVAKTVHYWRAHLRLV